MRYKIGIDIGGTNTDAVVLDANRRIVSSHKECTTDPIEEGVLRAVEKVLAKQAIAKEDITAIFLGTTHATNAILEAKGLLAVGHIRIAGQRPDAAACFFCRPELKSKILKAVRTIDGGYNCDGSPITRFCINQARSAVEALLEEGVEAISIAGAFSPINRDQEDALRALVLESAGPDFPVSCSADIGSLGFLQRENAAIINASLHRVISKGFSSLEKRLLTSGIFAPLYMVQNDGSIMTLREAERLPILTIATGQTNSFVGAMHLSSLSSAVVCDIGGTSTDVGVVQNGVARRSSYAADIGGISLQFAMPDVLSVAIGGGSVISDSFSIGPESVSRRILSDSRCFGGNTLTLTDVAVLLEIMNPENAVSSHIGIDTQYATDIIDCLRKRLTNALQIAQGKNSDLAVVVVGGAAPIVSYALERTPFAKALVVPEYASFANAVGAGLARVSARVSRIISRQHNRVEALESLKQQAIVQAEAKGAKECAIAAVETMPFAYCKDGSSMISVTASGVL